MLLANQWAIGAPPATYSGGVISNTVTVGANATLVIQASGTAWCGGGGVNDLWFGVRVNGVPLGSLNSGLVPCDGRRNTLTSAFVVATVGPGTHVIAFPRGFGEHDSADRWNVTVLAYSR